MYRILVTRNIRDARFARRIPDAGWKGRSAMS
jgi:hypothetical protein